MNYSTFLKKIVPTSLISIVFFIIPSVAIAQELIISENGQGSDNHVAVTVTQTTEVTQSNTQQSNTTIDSNANTGENTNSNNASDATIQTGDITTASSVQNTNSNINTLSNPCENCESKGTIIVTNNAQNSTSTVIFNENTISSIDQKNDLYGNATITNQADTGNNSSHANSGMSTIITGDITATNFILNKNINKNSGSQGSNISEFFIKIQGNAKDSRQIVQAVLENEVTVLSENNARLISLICNDFNTGGNNTSNNVGETIIRTGDIEETNTIENIDSNFNSYEEECCEEPEGGPKPEEPKTPPPPPITTPDTKPGNGDDHKKGDDGGRIGGGNGSVLAAKILPATGSFWMFLATVGSVMMFLLGLYLRLRSGRSPAYAYA